MGRKRDLLYELGYVLTVAVGLVTLLSDRLIGDGIYVVMLGVQLLIAGAFIFFKKTGFTGRMILIGVVLALAVAGFLLSKNETMLAFFMAHRSYLWLLAFGAAAFALGELMCFSGLVRACVSLASIGWMITALVCGYPVEKLFVCAAFLIILLTLVEGTQGRWEKQGQTEHRGHVVFVAPFILISILIVFISPAPEEPFDWGFAKRIVEAAGGFFDLVADALTVDSSDFGHTDPTESAIGFSDEAQIGGNLNGESREVMLVSGLSSQTGELRLSGKTFSDFNGKEWVDQDASEAHDVMMDTIAMWASLSDYTDRESDYARRALINVENRDLQSGRAFIPLKTVQTYHDMETNVYRDQGGDILWQETRGPGSIYSVYYYLLNTDHKAFSDFLVSAKEPSEKSYFFAEKQLNIMRMAGCDYSAYQRHVDHIRETYLSAPTLSPELRSYMDDIYKGAQDPIEKLQRLEKLLRSFTYTKKPGPLPDTIRNAGDFLDYFILKSRKGFCSHFATAFVLLARAEGIPARYVQGYLTDTDQKRSVYVRNTDAHAWPEVYIDGAGWITFEPTPSEQRSHAYWKTEEERIADGGEDTDDPEPTAVPDDADTDSSDKKAVNGAGFRWYMVGIPVGIAILFILLSFVIGRLIARARYQRMGEEEQLALLFRKNIRILRLYGIGMAPNETLYEYRTRLNENGVEDIEFLEDYERLLYKGELREDAVSRALREKEHLLFLLRKKSKRKMVRYYFF